MIGMEEKGFLETSEAVVADSDLLKKKLDAMRFLVRRNFRCCSFVFESDASMSCLWK